jgi:hypothetical protein
MLSLAYEEERLPSISLRERYLLSYMEQQVSQINRKVDSRYTCRINTRIETIGMYFLRVSKSHQNLLIMYD